MDRGSIFNVREPAFGTTLAFKQQNCKRSKEHQRESPEKSVASASLNIFSFSPFPSSFHDYDSLTERERERESQKHGSGQENVKGDLEVDSLFFPLCSCNSLASH